MTNTNTKKQLLIKNGEDWKNIYPINYIINVIDFESGESLESFIKRFNHVMITITGTKAQIRANVPSLIRHLGLHISFMNNDKLCTEYYKSTNYSDTEWIKDINWGFVLNDNNNNKITIDNGSITLNMLSKEVQDAISAIVDINYLQASASAIVGESTSANVTYSNGKFIFDFVLQQGKNGSNGINGNSPILSINDTSILVSYDEGSTWNELITLSRLTGAVGNTPKLRNNGTHIQVSYDNEITWSNLVDLNDIKGLKGDDGKDATEITKTEIIAKLNEIGECTMTRHWTFSAGVSNTGTN